MCIRDSSHTFTESGTYDYFCMIHPWMAGQVVVVAEQEVIVETNEEEKIIEVVDILALNATQNIIQPSDTGYIEIDKASLNDEHKELTISSWVKPDFSSITAQQYSIVSKEYSFELFLTNTKKPERAPGFSVFDGVTWNTILVDSTITNDWHYFAGVMGLIPFWIQTMILDALVWTYFFLFIDK